jgi:hypothetical protein
VTPHNGFYVIVDGYHRALKVLQRGDFDIPAKIVFHDILAQTKIGTNNQGVLNGYLEEASFNGTFGELTLGKKFVFKGKVWTKCGNKNAFTIDKNDKVFDIFTSSEPINYVQGK